MRHTLKTHSQQIRHGNLHPLLLATHLDQLENDQHISWSTTSRVCVVRGTETTSKTENLEIIERILSLFCGKNAARVIREKSLILNAAWTQ